MASHVTDTGLAEFVSALITEGNNKHVGWGTGTGAAVSATNLTTPRTTEARTSGTISAAQTTNTAGDTYQVIASRTLTTDAGPIAITEAGIFDATGTGAVLRVYGDFSAINLMLNDSITFTFNVVLNQV